MPESTISWTDVEPHLRVVILAGGVGSRFWPVSTPDRPKQLLPLASDRPLIVETLERALGLVPRERLRILTGRRLQDAMVKALPDPDPLFMLEPQAKGTAPALAWAAWEAAREDPDAVLISLHADHVIEPVEELHATLRRAALLAAREEVLVTLGIEPAHPATGFGYIRPGRELAAGDGPAFAVDAFVEKPDRDTAAEYLERGYLWNSGIFVWKARTFLEEVEAHAPGIREALARLEDGDAEGFFRDAPNVTVDVAILERSGRVATIPATFRWDDVGSWGALHRNLQADEGGNVVLGEAHVVDARDNTVVSEEGAAVLFGVEGLVVVRAHGVTLVTRRDRAQDLKDLLDELPPGLRNPGGPS